MQALFLHDRQVIQSVLMRDPLLHVYSIGDLDDFFWPYTCWYGLADEDEHIQAIALLYASPELPTLLAFAPTPEKAALQQLLVLIASLLPGRFYAHFSPGVQAGLTHCYDLESHGLHYRMALRMRDKISETDTTAVMPLGPSDIDIIQRLYAESYPDNWFNPRMLETGQYFVQFVKEQLVSIAGIHVYSPEYRVAALGNITTHPDFRGQGYGQKVTAGLCKSLFQTIDHIGLNVKADNQAAIRCYQGLGFEIVAEYEEMVASYRAL